MKDLGNAGFSVAQSTLMHSVLEAKWVSTTATNFCNNYQKSNKNHFLKSLENAIFKLYFQTFSGVTRRRPPFSLRCRPFRSANVLL